MFTIWPSTHLLESVTPRWTYYAFAFTAILTSSIKGSFSVGPKAHRTESLARSHVAALSALPSKELGGVHCWCRVFRRLRILTPQDLLVTSSTRGPEVFVDPVAFAFSQMLGKAPKRGLMDLHFYPRFSHSLPHTTNTSHQHPSNTSPHSARLAYRNIQSSINLAHLPQLTHATMDVAYNQHSPYARHNNSRSHNNLPHLTLAPLTSRLPLSDLDALPDRTSYLEGRSAPTTPSILSRSSSRVSLRKAAHLALPKSKSSTHLLQAARKPPRTGTTTPSGTRLSNELSLTEQEGRNDADWLLRAGAALSTSARESKGQAWLVSRASSTSLTGQRDEDDEELGRELAREREQLSRRVSRRGSTTADADDEFSPVVTRPGMWQSAGSRSGSRSHSRFTSRRGSRAQLFTPSEGPRDGYFDQGDFVRQLDFITEPDFVNAEEEEQDGLYEGNDEARKDDAEVRKLARANSQGLSGWVEKMLGWSLFAVGEDGEDDEVADEVADEKAEESEASSRISRRAFEGNVGPVAEEVPPPVRDGDVAGWQDAAWLLSVATKVLL